MRIPEKLKDPKVVVGGLIAVGVLAVASKSWSGESAPTPGNTRSEVPSGTAVYSSPGDTKPCGKVGDRPFPWPAVEATEVDNRLFERYARDMSEYVNEEKGRNCTEYWIPRQAQLKSLGQLSSLAITASY